MTPKKNDDFNIDKQITDYMKSEPYIFRFVETFENPRTQELIKPTLKTSIEKVITKEPDIEEYLKIKMEEIIKKIKKDHKSAILSFLNTNLITRIIVYLLLPVISFLFGHLTK
ncbi:MAG: hypothetical protein LBM19_01940 [Holosporales bacterium]|jgi:hypothetical protein|nr:hypothetical protein [Holosporales bacterium]